MSKKPITIFHYENEKTLKEKFYKSKNEKSKIKILKKEKVKRLKIVYPEEGFNPYNFKNIKGFIYFDDFLINPKLWNLVLQPIPNQEIINDYYSFEIWMKSIFN